jgi:hypothetical protein
VLQGRCVRQRAFSTIEPAPDRVFIPIGRRFVLGGAKVRSDPSYRSAPPPGCIERTVGCRICPVLSETVRIWLTNLPTSCRSPAECLNLDPPADQFRRDSSHQPLRNKDSCQPNVQSTPNTSWLQYMADAYRPSTKMASSAMN